jgi:hypothetical protein
MTIAQVGTATTGHADSSTASVAYVSGIASGNIGVLIIAAASGCDFSTPPTGWTWLLTQVDAGGSNINQNWFYKVLTGSETGSVSTTANNYGGSWIAHMSAWSGVDTTTPIDVSGGGTGGTTTAVQAPSVTATTVGLLLTAHAHTRYGASTATSFTPPSGMTEISDTSETGDGAQHALEVNKLALSATGATGIKSATCTVSPSQRCGVAVVLKPGTSTVTGTGAWTSATDTLAASGTPVGKGSAAWASATDTVAASGTPVVTGTAAWNDQHDSWAGSGSPAITGSSAWTNAPDAVAGVGTPTVTGDTAWTDDDDTWSGTGSAGGVTGDGAWASDDDTWSSSVPLAPTAPTPGGTRSYPLNRRGPYEPPETIERRERLLLDDEEILVMT